MTASPASSISGVPAFFIDCETAVRRLWDYLDNRLPDVSYAEVEAHLATCLLCPPHFLFAESMQRALADSAPKQTAGEEIAAEDRLRERVRRALRSDRAWPTELHADADEDAG
ncbi:MAG: hypothetical protein NVS4B3_21670 [Gemmatimonadaceae bacterium]